MHTVYYRSPGGAFSSATVSDGAVFLLPDGAEAVSKVEYDDAIAEIRAGHEAHQETVMQAEADRARGDYDALIALGLPAEMAARMSGHTPTAGGGA
jgi:hypothetical protein